ncbi:hypothetical protein ACJIZ3_017867 [Penstemon smallii]|uniref:Glycosyltransferase n=1 Tax=Penstemon smallii TaxID=265156 RepID=A0ABD3SX83_9LAMI
MEALGAQVKQRVVLVPYPYQGHMTPMLQLGSILHSQGFSIVVAHTEFNSPKTSDNPEFTFLPLSDNLSDFDTSFYNMLNIISAMNTNCKASFQDYLVQMMEEEELCGDVACIIYDSILHFVDDVATRLKIPTIVLRTNGAAYMHSHSTVLQLVAEKVFPLPESRLQDEVPELHPLRFKDLPFPATSNLPQPVIDFVQSYTDIRSSSAVIWNTVNKLDHTKLQQLQQQSQVPFFPIGPLHKMAPPLSTSLINEDTSCLSWLDKQAPGSVIYVSLGSLATIDEKELSEMAWGLAKSEQPFLWVVRPSLLNDSEAIEFLSKDFLEITKDRGCIVKWAPQKKVLAHWAVGGFLSHCGWNSTLESMFEGVPMICRPSFSDQMVNARYVTRVWRVGLELEQGSEGSIEKAVRKLMVGEEGKELTKRAFEMKQELEESMKEGGSSYESLHNLVEFIISLSGKK